MEFRPVFKKPEIIQQWQYLGLVHPELLKDEVFEKCKKAGISSLQSYLYWAEIEKESGKIDFSSYDALVERLKEHNLKWVPFLILGPNYATPKWFQESKESVYAKCLEHQKESKIQSIWNPNLPKHIEKFLRLVAEHYKEEEVLESILFGISGNWGEALYPANGGFYENFHTHPGWWAGDKYAKKSFINSVLQKYNSLEEINNAWGTNFSDLAEITFPIIKKNRIGELIGFLSKLIRRMPDFVKNCLKLILKIGKKSSFIIQERNSQPLKIQKREDKQYWLDFVNWYLDSMTNWAEFWLKTARKYFPDVKIYLVTGGTGNPISGADFSQQVKVAAKYKAGIRITNQTNDYKQSFILTRLVATAARFYNSYFVTEEEAVLQSSQGVIMRIFDALSSGAKGIYCKNFISIEGDPCLKENLPVGEVTGAGKELAKNLHHFTTEEPIVKIAVFFPNSSISLNPAIITVFYNKCALLRDIFDFDLIDERMIRDGILKKYQFFITLDGSISAGEVSTKIKEWIEKGGIIIPAEGKVNYLKFIKDILIKHQNLCPWLLAIDGLEDGVYATMLSSKIIYYNSNNSKKIKKVDFFQKIIEIEANSILTLPL